MDSMEGYYDTMRSRGLSRNTMKAVRKFKCPECGFEFSLVYARTFACRGCSESVMGCSKVRCAKCDTEFPIQEMPTVGSNLEERSLANHMTGIMDEYYRDMGWKKNR